ncbi:MAG: ABC transporter permease [Nitrososphaeria archaeon]
MDPLTILTTMFILMVQEGSILLIATLGEIFTERSGILNLGVEGLMCFGALSSFVVYYLTGNWITATLAAALAGLALSLIHAFVSITLKANQTVSGLAITILGLGLSSFIGRPLALSRVRIEPLESVRIPVLSDLPVIGPSFFNQNPLVYLSYIMVIILWFILYKTGFGLNLRSVGENPSMADSLGINVFLTRYIATSVGGALCGVSGALLILGYYPSWYDGITAGRGWIAVALVIFSSWNPLYAFFGAYFFGLVGTLNATFQSIGFRVIPTDFFRTLPYLLTIVVLVIFSSTRFRKRKMPASLGKPYTREL